MSGRFKIGDVFEVRISDETCGYFQYVADDIEQLGSAVIRIFDGKFACGFFESINGVASLETNFYAHVFLKSGVTLGVWKRTAHFIAEIEPNIAFRASNDYGDPRVKISSDWDVWRLGEKRRKVKILSKVDRLAERGEVMNPNSIATRIRTGSYDGPYPEPA